MASGVVVLVDEGLFGEIVRGKIRLSFKGLYGVLFFCFFDVVLPSSCFARQLDHSNH